MLSEFNPPSVDWLPILPMVIVAVTGMVTLILDMYRKGRSNRAAMSATLIGLGLAIVAALRLPGATYDTMGGMVNLTAIGTVGQLSILVAAFLVTLFSESYLEDRRISYGEFYPLLGWATFGGLIMCATTNLLALFVGIEILSVSLYVLAGLNRGNMKSAEAALKYFLLGAFATGFLLLGIAFFYGGTGSLELEIFNSRWVSGRQDDRLLLGLATGLITVGLGFKASLMPFHQWTPDVYQGSPTNVSAFMATAGKVGPFVALWHFSGLTSAVSFLTIPLFSALAVLTMTGGNLLAFAQRDVKRMLAYSSIANAGYVMVPVTMAATGKVSWGGLGFFLIGYVLTTIGTFVVISLLQGQTGDPVKVEDLKGMAKARPIAGAALITFVLSLIGLPLTAGFLAKFLFVRDAVIGGQPWLGIALVLNSIFGVVYYFNLIRGAYSHPEDGSAQPEFRWCPATSATLTLCMVGVIGTIVFYGPIASALGMP